MTMKLIADSGSTKTDWVILSDDVLVERFSTSGLNPIVMGIERFKKVVQAEMLPRIWSVEIDHIEFYGAGCTVEMQTVVKDYLKEVVPSAEEIIVDSDLMGACRAICGDKEGIVAILGTGSNSCLYDGKNIVAHTPSLGYILGDEGSGAALGKAFLNALLKKRLPQVVEEAFSKEFSLTEKDVLEKIYQGTEANTFLASFAPFIRFWSSNDSVRALIIENFRLFLRNNISQYGRTNLFIHCVGSTAHYFSDCLEEAVEAEGYHLGQVLRSPIDNLIPRS